MNTRELLGKAFFSLFRLVNHRDFPNEQTCERLVVEIGDYVLARVREEVFQEHMKEWHILKNKIHEIKQPLWWGLLTCPIHNTEVVSIAFEDTAYFQCGCSFERKNK